MRIMIDQHGRTWTDDDYKKCGRCQEIKSLLEFGGLKKPADYCKPCIKIVNTNHRNKNRDRINEQNRIRAVKRYQRNRQLLDAYYIDKSCVDCGERDPIVFEFDHSNPKEKKYKISDVLNSLNWETVLVEIAKCEIRCGNCHRIKTIAQFGHRIRGEEPVKLGAKDGISRAAQRKSCDNHRLWVNRGHLAEFFINKCCVDCGETNSAVFEFDHVRGKKKAIISSMIRRNCWTTILTEIEKCDIRCVNCHRRKTVLSLRTRGGDAQ